MDENILPSVILTDREIALMNAIQNVFPNASNLLYRWHISRNVLAHCKNYLRLMRNGRPSFGRIFSFTIEETTRSSQSNFLTSWTQSHGLLQLQHNEIKASFERSLILMRHSFKPSDFKELRGFVSINALNMILDKYERVDSNDFICSCVVLLTHELPSVHEISGYKREGRPIPLSSIHPHWRKLDRVPTTDNELSRLNCLHVSRFTYASYSI
ncbi:hypothetical protein Ddye_009696 [Dipteronia dyeriana]|uniref:MULE transposase domain-containing protein n=1 Tax=Dipteronia dyeriana TaxID=168575 RepID=A0AAD9XBX0_9ROSI|nr:hypothetical protein Ddye_009696 [Dipteronia dyeriana]